MTIDREALLPCPFCGGDAEIDTSQSFRHYQNGQLLDQVSVYCADCSANISLYPGDLCFDRHETIEFCIEAWNTRPDAALSALDQPAQEPVAWMYTNPNFPPGRPPNEVVFYRYENIGDNWIETPLYAAPQPATLPDDLSVAISQLRALCNDKIRKINQGRGVRTEGFRDINDLLKACDKVFATLPDASR